MATLLPLMLALAAGSPAGPGTVVYAKGGWAAIDRGPVCEAVSRSLRAPGKDRDPGLAGFSFTVDRRRWGQFHLRLGRMPREGSSVTLKVGRQDFLLESRGDLAWGRDTAQDEAIMLALRRAGTMSARGRDSAGRQFSEIFSVSGAATAIDAAAARCAGKSR